MADYITELRRLATMYEFGIFLDEALRDQFVCGLFKESIQRRLLAEADLTLKKALELAHGMEAAEDSKEIKATPGSGSQVQRVTQGTQQQKPQYHRCLGLGHTGAVCRFKTLKCNKCQKVGHIARACRNQSSQQPPRQPQQGLGRMESNWKEQRT